MTSRSARSADGWPGGWVVAGRGPGRSVRWLLLPDAPALAREAARCSSHRCRHADGLADRRASGLRRRGASAARSHGASSVFPAPVRGVLGATTTRTRRPARGLPALSAQAWRLVPRIADVDHALRADGRAAGAASWSATPSWRSPLTAGALLRRSARRRARRGRLLRPGGRRSGRSPTTHRPAGLDDALDARPCAWTRRALAPRPRRAAWGATSTRAGIADAVVGAQSNSGLGAGALELVEVRERQASSDAVPEPAGVLAARDRGDAPGRRTRCRRRG